MGSVARIICLPLVRMYACIWTVSQNVRYQWVNCWLALDWSSFYIVLLLLVLFVISNASAVLRTKTHCSEFSSTAQNWFLSLRSAPILWTMISEPWDTHTWTGARLGRATLVAEVTEYDWLSTGFLLAKTACVPHNKADHAHRSTLYPQRTRLSPKTRRDTHCSLIETLALAPFTSDN
jgi:hypothetical protein